MDDPPLVALALAAAFGLGFLLRLKGAFLAATAMAVAAAWFSLDSLLGNGPTDSTVGAAVLGAAAGFALGWAGSLTRRLLR